MPTTKGTPPVVDRPGALPEASRVPAPDAEFGSPAKYRDGLVVRVVRTARGQQTGQGPGAIIEPYTKFLLRFDNGTDAAIPMNQVVVSANYGSEDIVANPVYGVGTQDFSGTLRRGDSLQAWYAFAIPDGVDAVRLTVDFDGTHMPVVFEGSGQVG